MDKPHPIELRRRAVDFVEEGNSHRAGAAHFRVSIKFVNDMVKLKRETGSLEPKRQGNPGRGKLAGVEDWVRGRITEKRDLTLDDLVIELNEQHGIVVHRCSVWRLLRRLGLTHKKKICEPSSGSVRMYVRPAISGLRADSPSCAPCFPASALSMRLQ